MFESQLSLAKLKTWDRYTEQSGVMIDNLQFNWFTILIMIN